MSYKNGGSDMSDPRVFLRIGILGILVRLDLGGSELSDPPGVSCGSECRHSDPQGHMGIEPRIMMCMYMTAAKNW